MDLETFNKCNINKKENIVFSDNTIFIGFRRYYGQKVMLYDCGDFFAEIYHDTESNKIIRIEGLEENDNRINLYIEYMKEFEKIKTKWIERNR